MMKMKIRMDVEKILQEDVINLEKAYAFLDELFQGNGLYKESVEADGTVIYSGSDDAKDFSRFGMCFRNLKDKNPWFVPNCKVWLWGDDDIYEGQMTWDDVLDDIRRGAV